MTKWTRKQLLPQMRRTSLVLTGEGVELRIEWNIIFDWTGEAESIISASAKIPSSCKSHTTRLIRGISNMSFRARGR